MRWHPFTSWRGGGTGRSAFALWWLGYILAAFALSAGIVYLHVGLTPALEDDVLIKLSAGLFLLRCVMFAFAVNFVASRLRYAGLPGWPAILVLTGVTVVLGIGLLFQGIARPDELVFAVWPVFEILLGLVLGTVPPDAFGNRVVCPGQPDPEVFR